MRDLVNDRATSGQILRFLVLGGTNTVVTTAAFYGLATFLPSSAAFTIVYAAGLAFVVLVTPRYVFGSRSTRTRRLLLALWYLGTYAVGIGVISLLTSVADAPRIAVVLGTVLVTAPLGFIGARLLVAGPAVSRPGRRRRGREPSRIAAHEIAGSVVKENVPANAVAAGDPARIVASVDGAPEAPAREIRLPATAGPWVTTTGVRSVTVHGLTRARDLRGALTAVEVSELEFVPRRLFVVYDVPSESVRGAHAHRTCSQFLICLSGGVSCLVDDGAARAEIRLDRSDVGLYVSSMVWGTQWKYTRDAVLLVLASHPYNPDDYIRDYEEFLELAEGSHSAR